MLSIAPDKYRLINAFKTAFACFIAFMITKVPFLHAGQWLVISVVVVMCAQVNVGSMLQKSYLRFIGTVAGSLVAACTLFFFGNSILPCSIAMILTIIVFSYLATNQSRLSEAGILGAVTTAIILAMPNTNLRVALERFLEISGGILIAAVISQFVFPIHARYLLKRNQAKTLRLLRTYYQSTLLTKSKDLNVHYYEVDLSITKTVLAQRKLAVEAAHEAFIKKYTNVDLKNMLESEREILRAITFMHHTYKYSQKNIELFSSPEVKEQFHDKVCAALDQLAQVIEQKKTPEKKPDIDIPSTQLIKDNVNAIRNQVSEDEIIYADGYLFCAGMIVERLREILRLL